jgi:ornithine carbamoyltransferase
VSFAGYQVNESLMALAKPGALFMHCLPAHRGEEVTDEVMDGESSIVVEQAENRLHLQKALMVELVLRAGAQSPGGDRIQPDREAVLLPVVEGGGLRK